MIAEGRKAHPKMALYLWLAAITGARRGELCGLQVCDVDLKRGILHLAFNYLVKNGQRVRKDTKTHQDRYLAIDPVTCAMIREHLDAIRASLADFGLDLPENAYIFSNDPKGVSPWNPTRLNAKAHGGPPRHEPGAPPRQPGTATRRACANGAILPARPLLKLSKITVEGRL